MSLTQLELGWLIGLLEGEGCFDFDGSQRIALGMTDEDTVHKAAEYLSRLAGNKASVAEDYTQNKRGYQLMHYTYLYGENARIVMRAIVPYMSYRRRQQIWRSLNGFKAPKIKLNAAEFLKAVAEVIPMKRRA